MREQIFKIIDEINKEQTVVPVERSEMKKEQDDEADAFEDQDMMDIDEGVATKNMAPYDHVT